MANAQRLKLELTESLLVSDVDEVIEKSRHFGVEPWVRELVADDCAQEVNTGSEADAGSRCRFARKGGFSATRRGDMNAATLSGAVIPRRPASG